MNYYYLKIPTNNKAKRDINKLLGRVGYTNVAVKTYANNGLMRFLAKFVAMFKLFFLLRKDDILFLQYPMKKFYSLACKIAHHKQARVITIIHDLGSFRRRKLSNEEEKRLLSETDFLIIHNCNMEKFLIRQGYKMPMYQLKIFDYLTRELSFSTISYKNKWHLIYAGGLGHQRIAYLDKLDKIMDGYDLRLYGRLSENVDTNKWHNVHYKGIISSEDFIKSPPGNFGLIWDGYCLDECDGNWGEYLTINNPHKMSFYLCAGIPVIIWRRAAMAEFVQEERVGILIESLQELSEELSSLTIEEYNRMQAKAKDIGKKIRAGYYFYKALEAAEAAPISLITDII